MEQHFKNETENIRAKNEQAIARAYANINAALHNKSGVGSGINAILAFLNEKERVDSNLPLEEQLKFIEEKAAILTRYVTLEDNWHQRTALPMLIKTINGDYLAVIPRSSGRCVYHKDGKTVKITDKSIKLFTNDAICFYKGFGEAELDGRDLLTFAVKCTSIQDRLSVLLFSAIVTAAGLLIPLANNYIFSRIIPAGQATGTLATAALILSAVMVAAILRLLQALVMSNAMLRMNAYVQSGIFQRLLALKTDFFKNIKSGELTKRVIDFSAVAKAEVAKCVTAAVGIILAAAYLLQIYVYAPQLLAAVLLVTLVLAIVTVLEGIQGSRQLRDYTKALSDTSGFVYELFSGIEQVKLNGGEARMLQRWSEKYRDAALEEDKPFAVKHSASLYKLITLAAMALIFVRGTALSASAYIAFAAAYGAYLAAVLNLSDIVSAATRVRAVFALIRPVLSGECEKTDGKICPDSFIGEITIDNISFAYDKSAPNVIEGLSLQITPGENVAIIGASGCGKSTLIRLILGFEQADAGSVYIDGYDLRELNLKHLRRNIGTVLQSSGLISGSIYANITLTKPGASMAEVDEAVKMAGLTADIAALPMGIYTVVGGENTTLSGGQQQRILIARALINQPPILIFDEATNALDNLTQAAIADNINGLACTRIIVAHRLSTIENCDRILVMDKGGIAETGTFSELQQKDGFFTQLMKRQSV